MTWFSELTGVLEQSPEQVRREIRVEGDSLLTPVGKRLAFGRLETPSLGELRSRVAQTSPPSGEFQLREHIGDVRQLHADPANSGALFQVASQFNLLEMISPAASRSQRRLTFNPRDRNLRFRRPLG